MHVSQFQASEFKSDAKCLKAKVVGCIHHCYICDDTLWCRLLWQGGGAGIRCARKVGRKLVGGSFKGKERTRIALISFPVPCKICGAIPPFLKMVTKYSVD